MFTNLQFTKAVIYFDWKPCTTAKYRTHEIIAQDVTRLIEIGVKEYIYKTTKFRFLQNISVFFE